jgi:hypothetical protein
VNPPEAVVVHTSPERLRLRIPACRGDLRYFAKVRRAALKSPVESIRVNVLTGSILFQGENATPEAAARLGREGKLYRIAPALPVQPVAKRITAPLTAVDKGIREVSSGQVDLPGALFILLLFTALYEIASGRFKTPPWYTAFWYAFGLFTKAMIDREKGDRKPVCRDET